MTDKLRREVNKVVKGYVDQGVAEVVPGVVFIDEVSFLFLPSFSFYDGEDRYICLTLSVSRTSMRCLSHLWRLPSSSLLIEDKRSSAERRISSLRMVYL